MRSRPTLVIMAKRPAAGRVKTRLARAIGVTDATRFYRATAGAVIGRLAHDPRWRTVIAVDPDIAVADRFWSAHVRRQGQGRGDLGARMRRILRTSHPGPIAIIGTDVPGVRPAHIAAAFSAAGGNDVVFGPADDGGYWLIALRRSPRIIVARFDNVRWSTGFALQDTVANFMGLRIGIVDRLPDVDGADDYVRVRAWSGRRVLPLILN